MAKTRAGEYFLCEGQQFSFASCIETNLGSLSQQSKCTNFIDIYCLPKSADKSSEGNIR